MAILLCCGAIAWTANEIIGLKGEVIKITAKADAEKSENGRRFNELDKKVEKFELDVNKKLDKIEQKLEILLDRSTLK